MPRLVVLLIAGLVFAPMVSRAHAQTSTGCNGALASGDLQLWVVSIQDSGLVHVNGVDVRRPTRTPFTWSWGDGTITNGWFAQSHTFSDTSRNYNLQVVSHEDDGSTDCAQVLIAFRPQSHTGCGADGTPPADLSLWVQTRQGRGLVEVNGVYSGPPVVHPLTWRWGDGTATQGWFTQWHTYPTTARNYTLQVILHRDDGSTECGQLLVAALESPTGLTVDAVDGQRVTLRFTPPPSGPEPTGFVVKGGLLPGEVLAAIPTNNPAPLFTFVAPPGSFLVRVHTVAGADESAASSEVPLHVSSAVLPSAPSRLLGHVDGEALTLAWKNTYRGGPPSGVMLDVTGSFNGSLPLGQSERFNFSAVPPGTYTFTLRATNPGGSSAPSNSVTLTFPGTCSGMPSAPSNFVAYRVGTTIFAVWDPPASGHAHTHYLLDVSGAFVGTFPTSGRALNGTAGPGSYSLRVRSVNSCGIGPASPIQMVTIP